MVLSLHDAVAFARQKETEEAEIVKLETDNLCKIIDQHIQENFSIPRCEDTMRIDLSPDKWSHDIVRLTKRLQVAVVNAVVALYNEAGWMVKYEALRDGHPHQLSIWTTVHKIPPLVCSEESR